MRECEGSAERMGDDKVEANAFTAGVEPGGLTNDFEVRFLVCYLLGSLKKPVTFQEMGEILQETGCVNYFEYADAFSELTASGQVEQTPEGECRLLPLGEKAKAEFETYIPLSVREKTLEAARSYLARKRRLGKIRITYHAVEDGYLLEVRMMDYGTDLMNLQVFLPTEKDCRRARERIYQEPTSVYQGLLHLLLGESEQGRP